MSHAHPSQMPNLDTARWEELVHQVVWKMGRHFGFQAFNMNPKTVNLVSMLCHGVDLSITDLPSLAMHWLVCGESLGFMFQHGMQSV